MQARLTTLPAGSVPPVTILPPGRYTLPVLSSTPDGERFFVRVQYPEDFVKDHHVQTVAELADNVTRMMRARYGAETISHAAAPTALEAGQAFEIDLG